MHGEQGTAEVDSVASVRNERYILYTATRRQWPAAAVGGVQYYSQPRQRASARGSP